MLAASPLQLAFAADAELESAVAEDYCSHLGPLFDQFLRNPELSVTETNTAARLAAEMRQAGFEVTEGGGGTGIAAIMRNGRGALLMMRADRGGLSVIKKSGLAIASTITAKDREGNLAPVMHACGHDVHITSLVGTARQMAARRTHWSGTLMLIGQPAEERIGGARAVIKDRLWERSGKPVYALAFHVDANTATGKLVAIEGSPVQRRISFPMRRSCN